MPLTYMDKAEEDGDEDGLEVEVENPNIEDQLEGAASDGGVTGDTVIVEKDEEPEEKPLTAQERYNAFIKENPDVEEIHGKQTEKRIKKMTYDAREAERQRDAAIEFAQATQSKLTTLEKTQKNQDGAFIGERKSHLTAQLDTVTQELANAHSLNDSAGVAEATKKMAQISNQLDATVQTESRFKRVAEEEVEETPVYTAPKPTLKKPDAKAEAWAETNEWFGEDKEMTQGALAIHRTLVSQEGYLPQTDAYYKALDTRIRKNYPDSKYFKSEEVEIEQGDKPDLKQPASVVAPVTTNSTRSGKVGRIHLTSSQVRVAKKLGVPLKDYAKSLEAYNKDK